MGVIPAEGKNDAQKLNTKYRADPNSGKECKEWYQAGQHQDASRLCRIVLLQMIKDEADHLVGEKK
jgi:hypothetical protein